MKFKFLPHTADIKFQAFGNSLEEVFENSALALFKSLYNGKVQEKKEIKFKVKGTDLENLMYNFLEEFLVLFDSENFLGSKIRNLKLNERKFEIECVVVGNLAENYNVKIHIKSVTYSEMFIKKIKNKFVSQVVLDV